jgi:hypothetical protein
MTVSLITTHEVDAIKRLLEQYKSKPLIKGTLDANTAQIQELEDTIYGMLTNRSIYEAVGKQLDKIGQILGLSRPGGMDDDTYRGLLLGKIGVNTSQGQPEAVISFYKIYTQANYVHLQEPFPAGVILMSDTEVVPSLVETLWQFLQIVVAAGIRVDHYGVWNDGLAFGMDGVGGGNSFGFGDDTDLLVGGEFAKLYEPNKPIFKFDSGELDRDADGFGDLLNDPIIGGKLQSA